MIIIGFIRDDPYIRGQWRLPYHRKFKANNKINMVLVSLYRFKIEL